MENESWMELFQELINTAMDCGYDIRRAEYADTLRLEIRKGSGEVLLWAEKKSKNPES